MKHQLAKIAGTCLVFTFIAPSISLAVKTVAKEEWVAGMGDIFPAYICKEGSYVRACFQISPDECHSIVTEATKSCLRQYYTQIPELLEQPQDGSLWGNKVGTCVGTIVVGENREKRIASDQCSDEANWK